MVRRPLDSAFDSWIVQRKAAAILAFWQGLAHRCYTMPNDGMEQEVRRDDIRFISQMLDLERKNNVCS